MLRLLTSSFASQHDMQLSTERVAWRLKFRRRVLSQVWHGRTHLRIHMQGGLPTCDSATTSRWIHAACTLRHQRSFGPQRWMAFQFRSSTGISCVPLLWTFARTWIVATLRCFDMALWVAAPPHMQMKCTGHRLLRGRQCSYRLAGRRVAQFRRTPARRGNIQSMHQHLSSPAIQETRAMKIQLGPVGAMLLQGHPHVMAQRSESSSTPQV